MGIETNKPPMKATIQMTAFLKLSEGKKCQMAAKSADHVVICTQEQDHFSVGWSYCVTQLLFICFVGVFSV